MIWGHAFCRLRQLGLTKWADHLESQSEDWLVNHGDYARWSAALDKLPKIEGLKGIFDNDAVTILGECSQPSALQQALLKLSPWRKGPFKVSDVLIDSEWCSNLKWDRVLPHLAPLTGRKILDIGCGNAYYAWRMLAHSPSMVIGIEPSVLFNLQFQAIQRYLQREEISVFPIGIEQLPDNLSWFDTVFSMGVLYHRKNPIEHIEQLKSFLVSGGELCLETLVIDSSDGNLLVPEERYARMRNVWFIPSARELISWLKRCGFENIRLVDETLTRDIEQRSTEWMPFESLAHSLQVDNPLLTIEGLPAPRRAVILANKP